MSLKFKAANCDRKRHRLFYNILYVTRENKNFRY